MAGRATRLESWSARPVLYAPYGGRSKMDEPRRGSVGWPTFEVHTGRLGTSAGLTGRVMTTVENSRIQPLEFGRHRGRIRRVE